MRLAPALAAALSLASCGGGIEPSARAVAIPDLTVYLAQLRCPDGGLPATCANPSPQKASDQMSWRRWDGQDQYEDSVVSDDGAYWVTTWTYPDDPKGNGGEIYVSDGVTVSICCTQDGGRPGMQRFATWGLFNAYTMPCDQGWTRVDELGRTCRAMITYPAGVEQIVVDTVVSEHYSHANQAGAMERFYMGAGWGRLAWEAYSATGTQRVGAPLVGPSGAPSVSLPLVDRRLATRVVAMLPPLVSVTDLGWPPAGFAP